MGAPDLPPDLPAQVSRALAEDVGSGDVTASLIEPQTQGHATVLTREAAVVCGRDWVDETFRQLDPAVQVRWHVDEGQQVAAGTVLFELRGPARALLTGERTALNFLQTLSATATATRRYVERVQGTGCRILDTRKTLPGLRLAQKYAVRCGGGQNHRLGLYDMVLLKENHIMAAGSITAAIQRARALAPGIPVEIEVEDLTEFAEALAAAPDIIMLDEFDDATLREAVRLNAQAGTPVRLEASGGVDEASVRRIAEAGVHYISIGSLTKHVRAIDLSMRFVMQPQPAVVR
ncbi:MAG: hypothetical protein RL026_150 [Pseudomonadota bacterium]